ncbi:MAG: 2-succinyl-5-enolpyruvyl-6-hydroxy-3-cyclohexene-1-carboxylic-acid synthase [Candidatus Zixiibacteriota bacterium]
MSHRAGQLNRLWGRLLIEETRRCGAGLFCVSPGSRSTPLALAVAENERADSNVHFDERSAAYFAIGYARATSRPAVLISTSGTAAANYLPAVVEASLSNLPLIVLTADRPPELQDTGANQTIGQRGLFGDYVRWRFDMPCPNNHIPPEMVLTTVDQAVYRATRTPCGPVHLNCPFREPLSAQEKSDDLQDYLSPLAAWQEESDPYTTYAPAKHEVDPEAISQLAKYLGDIEKGILVVGSLSTDSDRQAVLALSRKLGWPTLPDITSGLRMGMGKDNPQILPYYDLALMSVAENTNTISAPETVLHIGTTITSKRLLQYLNTNRPTSYVHVASTPSRCDPNHQVTTRFELPIDRFCDSLRRELSTQPPKEWGIWNRAQTDYLETMLSSALASDESLYEPTIARLVSMQVACESALFVASSMPIRDLDAFACIDGSAISVAANRGASGIDGTIASAAGFSYGLLKTVTLLIGDLAFLHDLNSLSLVSRLQHPIVIVVINNGGGGIFSFLPVHKQGKHFESFFAAPHNYTFRGVAEMFGLAYAAPSSSSEFVTDYRRAQRQDRSTIIEIRTERESNLSFHQQLGEQARSVLGL